MKMHKKLNILFAIMFLVSCSSNDYIGETPNKEHPISIGSNAGMVTRAGENGLETYLPDGKKTVLFYGIKGTSASVWQDVFQNYVLTWQANTAGTTVSNSSDWEYVGGTSLATPSTTQTIKYWDYSANPYLFFGIAPAPASTDNLMISLVDESMTYTTGTVEPSTKFFYTRIQNVSNKEDYGKPVSLNFYNVLSKVRVGVYETIPGYAITDIKFHTSLDADGKSNSPVLISTDTQKEFATQGTYTITANNTNSDITVELNYDDHKSTSYAVGNNEAIPHISSLQLGDNSQPNTLGTVSNDPSFGKSTVGNGYVYALSDENTSRQLAIKCDYTLKSLSTGSTDVIEIKNQTAYVPAQFGLWRPNYAYTYLFKITDAGAGLYPISFDACVETWADHDDGTVTIVQKPSITTWQYEALPSEEHDVHYILAESPADVKHDVDIEVSITDVADATAQALEVCYYGPQITEGEFELYDKKAMEKGKNFVWAHLSESLNGTTLKPQGYTFYDYASDSYSPSVALMNSIVRADVSAEQPIHTTDGTNHHTYNDGTFLFGTFRPLLGGYYAIRFTYKVNDATHYAYKIIKIGEYSFLNPTTIQIDDDYQHGIVIE